MSYHFVQWQRTFRIARHFRYRFIVRVFTEPLPKRRWQNKLRPTNLTGLAHRELKTRLKTEDFGMSFTSRIYIFNQTELVQSAVKQQETNGPSRLNETVRSMSTTRIRLRSSNKPCKYYTLYLYKQNCPLASPIPTIFCGYDQAIQDWHPVGLV